MINKFLTDHNFYCKHIQKQMNDYNSTYSSDVCFVDIGDISKSIQERNYMYITFNEDNKKHTGFYNLTNKNIFNPIIKKHYIDINKNLINDITPVRKYVSYIMVLNDNNFPLLRGDIMLFSFGKRMMEKINNTDDIYNRVFKINVKKTSGFLNYDDCFFSKKYNVLQLKMLSNINQLKLSLDDKIMKPNIDLDNLNRSFKLMKIKKVMK